MQYIKTIWWVTVSPVTIYLILSTSIVFGNEKDGESLFLEHCAECHGTKGDGRGPVGPYLEEQRPADLHALKTIEKPDSQLFDIIKHGVYLEMPSWEGVLSDQQIQKIVEYLRILAPPLKEGSQ